MLASISPLGERARGSRWSLTVASHVVASTLAGGVLGAALGLLGSVVSLSRPARGWLLAAVIVAALVVDASPRIHLPSIHRQVDEDWLGRYRGWVYGGAYGFQLGLGVVTIVTTAATYAALAASALCGSSFAGALIGATFGATRGLVVLTNRSAVDVGRLRDLHRRLQRLERPSWVVAMTTEGAALAVVVGALVVGARP
jgi:sulfite exporter TauE/SafE